MSRFLSPLRNPNFRLLWAGTTISLVGDGFYYVAIGWQTLALSNAATALSLVWLAFVLPHVLTLLFGGVVSDRLSRRRVLIAANLASGVALAVVGFLSLAGDLRLWELFAFVAVYGAAEAVYGPAYGAIVPDVVDGELLAQANSLNQLNRPLALRLVGPALGGVLVAGLGPGAALAIDAGTFAVSAACVARIRLPARPPAPSPEPSGGVFREIRDGLETVRQTPWLWAGMCAYAIGTVVTWGCIQSLLPLVVRNDLGGSARSYGIILGAGGVGSIVAAVGLGHRGLPSRPVTLLFWMLAGKVAAVSIFGLADNVQVAMLASLLMGALTTVGLIVWNTLIQERVPRDLLGRVNSIDWFVSTSLTPLALIAIGPVADAVGAQRLLVAAGAGSALLTLAFLLVPGVVAADRVRTAAEAR